MAACRKERVINALDSLKDQVGAPVRLHFFGGDPDPVRRMAGVSLSGQAGFPPRAPFEKSDHLTPVFPEGEGERWAPR